MAVEDEIRQASEQFYAALNREINGDPGQMVELWSHGSDVATMHPLGGRELGWVKTSPVACHSREPGEPGDGVGEHEERRDRVTLRPPESIIAGHARPPPISSRAQVQSIPQCSKRGISLGGPEPAHARARSDSGFSAQSAFFTTCTSSTVDVRGRSRQPL